MEVEEDFEDTEDIKDMKLIGLKEKRNSVKRFLVSSGTRVDKLIAEYCKLTQRSVNLTWVSLDGEKEVSSLHMVREGDTIFVHDLKDLMVK